MNEPFAEPLEDMILVPGGPLIPKDDHARTGKWISLVSFQVWRLTGNVLAETELVAS